MYSLSEPFLIYRQGAPKALLFCSTDYFLLITVLIRQRIDDLIVLIEEEDRLSLGFPVVGASLHKDTPLVFKEVAIGAMVVDTAIIGDVGGDEVVAGRGEEGRNRLGVDSTRGDGLEKVDAGVLDAVDASRVRLVCGAWTREPQVRREVLELLEVATALVDTERDAEGRATTRDDRLVTRVEEDRLARVNTTCVKEADALTKARLVAGDGATEFPVGDVNGLEVVMRGGDGDILVRGVCLSAGMCTIKKDTTAKDREDALLFGGDELLVG